MAVKIGIIGLGTVGSGVYELIQKQKERIADRVGGEVVIKKVCDKRRDLIEKLGISGDIFTDDYTGIIDDDEISLVIILTGDSEFAYKVISECFSRSKHVVTANKALLASRWKDIFGMARKNKCLIYFEAAVGSGIPVIQGINEGLVANRIDKVKGILNGTTNYILTSMSKESCSLEEATARAVKSGYAEADSSSDLTGLDAAHKICVLGNVIFPEPIDLGDVYREGIDNLQAVDIKYARDMFGFNIKLLSVIRRHEKGIEVRVHPALLPPDDMMYNVNYENNGIIVEGDSVGQVMFYGKGAGKYPAASGVVSDVIYLAQKIRHGIAGEIPYIHTDIKSSTRVLKMDNLSFQYYVRFTTADMPGVLSRISGILGKNGVSIASCFQKGHSSKDEVPILMITHMAKEGDLKKALKEIDGLDVTKKKSVFIRIESDKEIS